LGTKFVVLINVRPP